MIKISTGLQSRLLLEDGIYSTFTNGVIRLYSNAQPLYANMPAQAQYVAEITQDGEGWAPISSEGGLQFDMVQPGILTKFGTWVLKPHFLLAAPTTVTWFRLFGFEYDDPIATSSSAARLDGAMGTDFLLPNSNYVIDEDTEYEVDVFQLSFFPFL